MVLTDVSLLLCAARVVKTDVGQVGGWVARRDFSHYIPKERRLRLERRLALCLDRGAEPVSTAWGSSESAPESLEIETDG